MLLSLLTQETIAAVATAVAPGQGGIAVVRISGQASEAIVRAVVNFPGKQKLVSHRVFYGHVMDNAGKAHIDEVLVLVMNGPRSFTGEDVVEIHCHGGLIVVQKVLERVLEQEGVRRALPGEFTQRAVLNGRLDLSSAEAISDLIGARSRRAAELAMAGVDGGVHRRITALRERLLHQLCELEARVDFEEDLPVLDSDALLAELSAVRLELEGLVEDAQHGALIRQGLRVTLIGCPNVGKSSLLNRLSRRERAIVTDLPGTTRDLLESEIVLDGVPITLFDTAGIRETDDALEKIGIDRSHQALMASDVVVMVFDFSKGWTSDDESLLAQIPEDVPRLVVANKVDLGSSTLKSGLKEESIGISPDASISALTGYGEEELIKALLTIAGATEGENLLIALNERQTDLALAAVSALTRSKAVAEQQLPWDFWTIDLRQAISSLGEITGEEITEAVLDKIFSRFCIGK